EGGTPTGLALKYALTHPGYAQVRSLVLLSDGAPTGNVRQLTPAEQMELVRELTRLNAGRVKINTIGIGSEFRKRNSTAPEVMFMRGLAERNGGFYVGF